MKQTFDTEEKIAIKENKILEENAEFVINPYDEYAIEEGIKLRDELGGEVTLLSVGPERVEQSLRKALAMGADKAILVQTDNFDKELDEFSIANILKAAIEKENYTPDIIICGYMAVDDGAAQIGPRLAELLKIPHVSTITKLTLDGTKVTLEKDIEGDTEFIESFLPLLVTAQQGLNEPRYPSIQGIMKAKRKPMAKFTIEDLALEDNFIDNKTKLLKVFTPPQRSAGKILNGEVNDQVTELVNLLQMEAKVI